MIEELRQRARSIYPGWWVMGACCVLAVLPGAIFSYGFPVFYLSIQRDLMLTSAQTSLIFALARGEAGVGGPLIGWLIDRFDPRPIVLVGGIMAGVGLIVLSDISQYWLFMLVYVGLVSVGHNSGFGQTFLAVMNRWFVRRRAVGMTMVVTSYTIGGAIMLPLLTRGVDYLGWREVMLYAGIFVAAIVVPMALLIRRSPESMGLRLEDVGEALDSGVAATPSGVDFTVRQALRTSTYWFILMGSTLRIAVTGGILVHGFPIMVWKGTSEQVAGDVLGLLFFASIPARFIIGMSGVRVPAQGILAAGMASGAAAVLALTLVEGTWIIWIFVLGIALLEGASVLNWVLLGNIFGRRNFATLTGIISIFYSAGMMLSPLFLGWLFDRTGSYHTSLLVLASLYGTSAVLFAMCRTPRRPAV